MCVWRVLRLTIYVLVIMVSLALAREFVDKRSPDEKQSWYLGSRYGRSSGGAGGGSGGGSASRHLIVTPRRDDRFHPGSRYGKRAMPPPPRVLAPDEDMLPETSAVRCSYTGVADLYRCHVRKENTSGELLSN